MEKMATNENKIARVDFLEAYKELFNEFWRYIVFYGGRYSGKSYHIGLALLIRGYQKRLRFLCTREIQNSIKDSVHKLLKDQIAHYEFSDYEVTENAIVNHRTGSDFIFKGLRDTQGLLSQSNLDKIKSLEGVDVCWIAEGQSITDDSLDVLIPTIRKEGSQIIVDFNRTKKEDPVYTRFIKEPPPKTFSAHCNYDILEGTGFLSDTIKTEIEYCKLKRPGLFKHIYLGEPKAQSEDAIIKIRWFKYYTVAPQFEYRFLTADTAQKTKEANDFSVFACWGVFDGKLYLIDLCRGKWEAPELKKRALQFWQKHNAIQDKGFLRTFYIEDKSSGTGLIQEIQREGKIPIMPVQRDRDKYSRCYDIVGYIEAGLVYILEGADFTNDFLQECESFSADDSHEHDDQVDNLIDAVKVLAGAGACGVSF